MKGRYQGSSHGWTLEFLVARQPGGYWAQWTRRGTTESLRTVLKQMIERQNHQAFLRRRYGETVTQSKGFRIRHRRAKVIYYGP